MRKFIGCKCVEAVPCKAWKEMGTHKIGEDGYKVIYPDGYITWSPKDVFEAAYVETPFTIKQEELREYTEGIIKLALSNKCFKDAGF